MQINFSALFFHFSNNQLNMTDKEKGTPASNMEKDTGDIVVSESQNSKCEEEPCSNDDVEQQRKKNLFTTRILPFFGLQLALFIAVLDMYVDA